MLWAILTLSLLARLLVGWLVGSLVVVVVVVVVVAAAAAAAAAASVSETELKLLWNKVMASLPQLTKDAFEGALRAAGLRDSDAEILTKIFVLCDDTGDEVVDAQKFMAAASVLVAAEADRKFATAFSFYDFASSGKVSLEDAISAVTGSFV